MNRDQLLKSAQDFFVKAGRILDGRNRKYADPDNAFSNFERSARIAHLDVTDVFMVQIAEKLARIQNWLEYKEDGDEPVTDSLIDAVNFLILLNAWLEVPAEPLKDEPVVLPPEEPKNRVEKLWNDLFSPKP